MACAHARAARSYALLADSNVNFEQWFGAAFSSDIGLQVSEEEKLLVVLRLHQVLRPFLLRRLKKDVATQLPSKVRRCSRRAHGLASRGSASASAGGLCRQVRDERVAAPLVQHDPRGQHRVRLRARARARSHTVRACVAPHADVVDRRDSCRLQNVIMQLRKCCNHPFVFLDADDERRRRATELVRRASGKFDMLDRMLPKLMASGHKVLIFCQMTQVMDVLGSFLELRGWQYARLDGSTGATERAQLVQEFCSPDNVDVRIFVLRCVRVCARARVATRV